MSALESLDGYLKQLERKMRLAAWTRGVTVAAFCALIATALLVLYTNSTAFADKPVIIARFVLFLVLALGLLRGERITAAPSSSALLALAYLTTFGSLAALSAYAYLLKTVSPTLATSYAFVNPAIALLLGAVLAGEHVGASTVLALPIILLGVAFVAFKPRIFQRKAA